MGQIERGGGDGGEPVRSPQGRQEFSSAAWLHVPLRFHLGVPRTDSARHAALRFLTLWAFLIEYFVSLR